MGTFIIKRQKDGQFMYNLKAKNGETILTSEGYTTKQNCIKGINSVKKNSSTAMILEKSDDLLTYNGNFIRDLGKNAFVKNGFFKTKKKDGEERYWYFSLIASNGEIIGRSESYTSSAGMENGINSVIENAPNAEIKDRSAWWYNIFK